VNSENTNMQMDRFYGVSTSATIRYLGAHRKAGKVVDDVIENDMRGQMQQAGVLEVDPTTVLVTGAGALEQSNGVKRIFHVASVRGEPRQGYHPVRDLKGCVKNALREMGSDAYRDLGLASILFPIFGTGPGGGNLQGHAELCVAAVMEFLEANADSPVRDVGFYVWSDVDLEVCMELLRKHPGVAGADAA
jgi:O-acetyl-ADP-ribose deacetylase (regulator of RNase III)